MWYLRDKHGCGSSRREGDGKWLRDGRSRTAYLFMKIFGNSRDYCLGVEHKQGVGTKWFEIVTWESVVVVERKRKSYNGIAGRIEVPLEVGEQWLNDGTSGSYLWSQSRVRACNWFPTDQDFYQVVLWKGRAEGEVRELAVVFLKWYSVESLFE